MLAAAVEVLEVSAYGELAGEKHFFAAQIPYELVSLMELLRFEAEAYCRLTGLIGQLLSHFHSARQASAVGLRINDEVYKTLGSAIGEMGRQVDKLELSSAKKHFGRMKWTIENEPNSITEEWVARNLSEFIGRIVDELEDRLFLSVPASQASLYLQPSAPFGDDVNSRFPVAEDVSEAGKCLSLNRSTAAVFHLMRVTEIAVQRFGDKLGVPLVTEKNWQNILDQINSAIRAMNHKDPKTRAYAEAASHLYNVKVAWRNEVMHPKQTYTFEEAKAIFDNVKTFMNDLVGIV
jgi:hypothetical protein